MNEKSEGLCDESKDRNKKYLQEMARINLNFLQIIVLVLGILQ
jgi:hypothetical protein